jgi:glycosyltransferase involved in cell wall biosynthesis
MGTCKFFTNTNVCKKIVVIHFDPQYGYNHFFNGLWALKDTSFIEKLKRIARCTDYYRRKKNHYNYLNSLYSYWFKTADRVCLLSDYFISDILKVCDSVDTSKLVSINNPNTFNNVYNSDCNRKKQVLWIGRLDMKQKRPDRIIRIWKRIYKSFPDWNLIIAGDGEMREYLESLTENIPSIKLVGRVDVKPYYRESQIICMTSTIEGWGMVLTEAISYGVIPLAFTSFNSINDIIKSPEQLIRSFNIKEYAEKLSQMMRNDVLRQKIRNKGYEIIQNYSANLICDKWESIIQTIIKEK